MRFVKKRAGDRDTFAPQDRPGRKRRAALSASRQNAFAAVSGNDWNRPFGRTQGRLASSTLAWFLGLAHGIS